MKTLLLTLLLLVALVIPAVVLAQDASSICREFPELPDLNSASCDDTGALVCVAFPDGSLEQRVSYYMGEGAGFYESGQYERALLSYSCVIEQIAPDTVAAFIQRASTFSARHDYPNAIDDYTAALNLDGSLPGVYNNRGIVHAAQQEYDEALDDLNQALTLDANYVLGYTNRAVISAIRGDYEGAISDLNTALDLSGIQDIVDSLRDPNRDPNAPWPEFDQQDAWIYALFGVVRSAQSLDHYQDYLLLTEGQGDYRIQSAAGALESRLSFELRLDDGTWLLAQDFTEAGEEVR